MVDLDVGEKEGEGETPSLQSSSLGSARQQTVSKAGSLDPAMSVGSSRTREHMLGQRIQMTPSDCYHG